MKRAFWLTLLLLAAVAASPAAAAPSIRVFDVNFNEIQPGSIFFIGAANSWEPFDRDFRISNYGDTQLIINNPTTFLSGTGFTLLTAPAGSISPSGTSVFRVRFQGTSAGDYFATLNIQSNSATHNPFVANLSAIHQNAAHLRVTDGVTPLQSNVSYNLGSTAVGTPITRTFTFTNDGTLPLSVSLSSVTGSYFTSLKNPVSPLNPGQSDTFIAQFNPATVGLNSGTFSWNTNSAGLGGANFRVRLTGTGLGSKVRIVSGDGTTLVNGGTYVYPTTTVGTAVSRGFTLFNDGNSPLTISNYQFSAPGAGFNNPIVPGSLVNPSANTAFRVALSATAAGTFNSQVTFNTNDPSAPTYTVNFRGTVQLSSGAPQIRIVSGDGVTLVPGSLYQMPSTTAGVAVSRLFTIFNDGTADLVIANPTGFVSGTGFSQIVTPTTPIPAGGSSTFRVRLMTAAPGTFNGSVSVQSNAAGSPFAFSLRGTVN